jgi:DnaJ-class molecular chaperone
MIGDVLAMPDPAALESQCPSCGGRGGVDDIDGRITCMTCRGRGFIPTETGEKVLALIRHNIGGIMKVVKED